jgi:hypothetical protein
MTPTVLFFTLFGATLVLLLGAIASGLRGKRKLHLPCVAATVVLLLATIWQAYRLGAIYDLPTAGRWTPVHMFLARAAAFSFVPTALLGLLTLRDGKRRRLHGLCAWTAFALTAAAAVTGTVMLSKAELRSAQAPSTAALTSRSAAGGDVVARDPR